jgi:hypothetical protein
MWPLSIVHGLLAGRKAHPYVDWSYGACVALVALALMIRFVATIRGQQEKAPHGLPDYVSSTAQAPMPPVMQQQTTGQWAALAQAPGLGSSVPQARDPRGAMPLAPRAPRALPPAAADRTNPQQQPHEPRPQMYPQQPQAYPQQPQAYPQQPHQPQPQTYPQQPHQPQPQTYPQPRPQPQPRNQPPSIATRRLATPRPDLPIPQSHQQEMRPWQQREWQEQQQDVTPWQQQEWEQNEWQQHQAIEPGQAEYSEYPEYPPDPDYPVYPAYPGAEGS